MKGKKQRVNITVPWEMYKWYKEKAEDMGTSMSFMMVLAMKTYVDQQNTLKISKDIPYMLDKLEEMGLKMTLEKEEDNE